MPFPTLGSSVTGSRTQDRPAHPKTLHTKTSPRPVMGEKPSPHIKDRPLAVPASCSD